MTKTEGRVPTFVVLNTYVKPRTNGSIISHKLPWCVANLPYNRWQRWPEKLCEPNVERTLPQATIWTDRTALSLRYFEKVDQNQFELIERVWRAGLKACGLYTVDKANSRDCLPVWIADGGAYKDSQMQVASTGQFECSSGHFIFSDKERLLWAGLAVLRNQGVNDSTTGTSFGQPPSSPDPALRTPQTSPSAHFPDHRRPSCG